MFPNPSQATQTQLSLEIQKAQIYKDPARALITPIMTS